MNGEMGNDAGSNQYVICSRQERKMRNVKRQIAEKQTISYKTSTHSPYSVIL